MAYNLGWDFTKVREAEEKFLKTIPFSSETKKMSCLYQNAPNIARVYAKGAPDYLIEKCTHYISDKGELPISNEFKD